MRKFLLDTFFLSIMLALSAIPAIANTSATLDKITLQLNWKYQFEFAGFIAAKEKGFYQEAGLDVDLVEYQNGMDIVSDVLDEKKHFGIHYSSIIVKNKKVVPSKLLATYFQKTPYVFATATEIKTPHDLQGKRVMMPKQSLNDTALGLLLAHFYLNDSNVTFVPPSFNIQDFIDGKVDAVAIFRTNEAFHLEEENIDYNIISPADYGYATTSLNLFTSPSEAAEHPMRTKAFVDASNRGWEYALSHQQEIIELIYNKYSQNKSIAALQFEAIETKKLIQTESVAIGEINHLARDILMQQLKRSGLLGEEQKLLDKPSIFTIEQRQYLDAKKEITMCVDPDWLPFEKISKGQHIGISADIFSHFRQLLPIPIRLIETNSWTESLNKALNRQCDILSLATNTLSRREYMDFTPAYIELPVVLATRNDTIFIDNISEVKDKKLAVVKGYSLVESLRKRIPDINIIEVQSLNDGLKRVESGDVFGYIDNLMSVAYAIQKDFSGTLKVSSRLQDKAEHAVATRNDQPQLNKVFTLLVEHLSTADLQSVYNNWIVVKEDTPFDYRILWLLLALIVISIIAFILGLQRLNKKLTQKNEQAEQEQQRFESLFEASNDGLVLASNGMFLNCNQSAVTMMGYDSKADLLRISPLALSPKYQPDGQLSKVKMQQMKEECLSKGTVSLEWFHQKKNGNLFWVESTAVAIHYNGEKVIYVTWHDISYRKQLELEKSLEQERFKILFEQSGNALLLIHNGVFIDCNKKAFKMLGYDSKEELMAKIPAEDLSPKYQPDGKLSLQKCIETTEICLRDGSYQSEWLHTKKDGSEILIDLTLTKLNYRDKKVVYVTWRDLTAQKEYELNLINAREEALQATQSKSEFLSNMSHELRTPMHGILSFSNFGIKNIDTAPKEKLLKYFSLIKVSGDRLLSLLNDLLDLSKLDAGKAIINLKKHDLAELFFNCQMEQEQRLNDLGQRVEMQASKTVGIFDPVQIGQVLTNILSNAIKFSPENSTISVSIYSDKQNLIFSLKDQGVGIPESEMTDIFDAFIQSSKTDSGAGGTGLGLSISKKIIAAHNGKLWAESNSDKGATFTFSLPLFPEQNR